MSSPLHMSSALGGRVQLRRWAFCALRRSADLGDVESCRDAAPSPSLLLGLISAAFLGTLRGLLWLGRAISAAESEHCRPAGPCQQQLRGRRAAGGGRAWSCAQVRGCRLGAAGAAHWACLCRDPSLGQESERSPGCSRAGAALWQGVQQQERPGRAHGATGGARPAARAAPSADRRACAHLAADGGAVKAAPYKELEALHCNLSAFPDCKYFRVEVGGRAQRHFPAFPGEIPPFFLSFLSFSCRNVLPGLLYDLWRLEEVRRGGG